MGSSKKGLSSFETFWIAGCAFGLFGILLDITAIIWTGLVLFALGVVSFGFKR